MSREADFATRMTSDVTLMAILLGGVHKAESVGPEGVSRDTTPPAFDADGFLKPCTLVKQAGRIPDGVIRDYETRDSSTNQRVEVWLYQDRTFVAIDAAATRIYTLFQGHRFSDTFEIYLANDLDRQRDMGALNGASLRRLDFIVPSILT